MNVAFSSPCRHANGYFSCRLIRQMEESPQKKLFRFGVFEADQHTGELRKQGRRIPLQGQPFDILMMLLEQSGTLVTRTQIR